jgi:hypothetical protein
MDDAIRRVPGWFWGVAGLALLWEAAGCFAYLSSITQADDTMPTWVSAAFAVAVWVGVSGAILLLLRNRLARTAFAVSLLAAIVQLLGVLFAMRSGSPGQPAMLYFAVVAGGVLLWFADHAARRGWLR